MKYRVLGASGLRVSQICVGTLMLSSWGRNSFDESEAIIRKALDHGINYFDTADSYARGESEIFLGRALKNAGRRDRIILATKVNSPMGPDPNSRGSSRRWIMRAVEESLKRLGTDWIDIYQLHRPDPCTDLEETVSVLQDLVQAGKIRYFGTSTFPASSLVEAQWVADRRGRSRPLVEQPPYSILAREIEREVLPTCAKYRLGVSVWSPLAGGWLSGKFTSEESVQTSRSRYWGARYDMSKRANQDKLKVVKKLADLCQEFSIELNVAATAFVLNHPAVTSAIVGPRTISHLDASLVAADTKLPAEFLNEIDGIAPPGITISDDDSGYTFPAISETNMRRRHD
ncbi:aldo/keto reductase [Nguyenibacter vanlangensis]|uniref:Aldo/keto reductase n=1 Tax=Nguyenibacter vanlangensis TaxID=1216886 RepID=A0A7Y7M625_9PROT|nr:aldo/keto reductase [Nguyenibacter vanlangensis]NVN10073.1 aldo/keto reductase [Nguyenibacter vanlangensis]